MTSRLISGYQNKEGTVDHQLCGTGLAEIHYLKVKFAYWAILCSSLA